MILEVPNANECIYLLCLLSLFFSVVTSKKRPFVLFTQTIKMHRDIPFHSKYDKKAETNDLMFKKTKLLITYISPIASENRKK